jgi:hypothetical protein
VHGFRASLVERISCVVGDPLHVELLGKGAAPLFELCLEVGPIRLEEGFEAGDGVDQGGLEVRDASAPLSHPHAVGHALRQLILHLGVSAQEASERLGVGLREPVAVARDHVEPEEASVATRRN